LRLHLLVCEYVIAVFPGEFQMRLCPCPPSTDVKHRR
jgi:hypothetical protein